MTLAAAEAVQMIEQLRYGLPPRGSCRRLTASQPEMLRTLEERLCRRSPDALLIEAGYGGGKSHTLHVIREMALAAGYVVSLVTANAAEGARFDRMDMLFGAICRELEIAGAKGRGAAALFGALAEGTGDARAFAALSSNGRWDYSEYLQSPAMYVALRAWLFGDAATRLTVEDWLAHPHAYRDRRRRLYDTLVHGLRHCFRDPRPEWKFHAQELLVLDRSASKQTWAALTDLDRLARLSGKRGLVLLFDEAEDMVHNLARPAERQEALRTLLRFFPRTDPTETQVSLLPPFHAYFAVTPDFLEHVRRTLTTADSADDIRRLPTLSVAPVQRDEFLAPARRIREAHAQAYSWDAAAALPDSELAALVDRLWQRAAPERLRCGVQGVVQALDDLLGSATL